MKAIIERAVLLKGLSHVQPVVERRNTIPILSNVLIEAVEGEGLKLTATDLDLQIVEAISAAVEVSGSTSVSAHTIFEIVRHLPEGSQILIASADGKMQLESGRSRFNLPTLPREDFPVIPDEDLPPSFSLSVESLVEIIDKTSFAMSTEETRYYLNGIFLHVDETAAGARLKAAATDGHRLAHIAVERPEGAADMPDAIVPRKCISEIRKLLEEAQDTVEIAMSTTKIRFTLGQAVLTSKLIDGTFPDYTRVIPTANDKLLKIDPRHFCQGVERVASIASGKTCAVKIGLDKEHITLSVSSAENGTATEELLSSYSDEAMEIGFNASYLSDILRQIDTDGVDLHLADAHAPTLIRGGDDSAAIYVLMPMRV